MDNKNINVRTSMLGGKSDPLEIVQETEILPY